VFVQKQFEADPFNSVAREREAGAGLAGRDTAYAEGAADFGCLVGGGGKVMTAKNRGLIPNYSKEFALRVFRWKYKRGLKSD
jgi:hypothetical protein